MSDRLASIKKLYFETSRTTIDKDFDEAIDLLKAMPSDDERDRAAVYMDGLAQMKAQWRPRTRRPSPASSAQPLARPQGRSDRPISGRRRR